MPDERLLIAGCKQEKMWARKKLYELYAPAMLSLCVRYVGNRETARDILQDGFIKIFTKIDGYAGMGSFEGWMRRIFVTTALEHLRANRISKDYIENYSESIEDIETSVLEKISADELLKCIADLPEGFRTIFNLYAIEGYSHAEIAGMLNIKESTSRSQFARARQVLQKNVQSIILHDNARRKK